MKNSPFKYGKLLLHQLHTIGQCLELFEQPLVQLKIDGKKYHAEYFIADGMGAGKTVECIGIMMMLSHKYPDIKRHVIVCPNEKNAFNNFQTDAQKIGVDPQCLFLFSEECKRVGGIPTRDGIGILTYNKLAQPPKNGASHYQRLVEWLGDQPCGIFCDEVHECTNFGGEQGFKGKTQGSQSAAALHKLKTEPTLSLARIINVSATMFSEANDLKAFPKAGLYGCGTPFPDAESLINYIKQGGIALLELVPIQLAARGQYCAREISYQNVQILPSAQTTLQLTEAQRLEFNLIAEVLYQIQNGLDSCFMLTGLMGEAAIGKKRGDIMCQFYSMVYRLARTLFAAYKTPQAIQFIRELQQQHPNCKVVVYNDLTGAASEEAAYQRAIDEAVAHGLEVNVADIEVSIKEELISWLEKSWNIYQYTSEERDGKQHEKQLLDENGIPVICPESVALRDKLIEKVILTEFPPHANLQLRRAFSNQVAEITSAKKVFKLDENGVQIWTTKPSAEQAVKSFQSGGASIAVLGPCGSSQINLHDSPDFPQAGQGQRYLLFLTLPQNADDLVQVTGRVHRVNQQSSPVFAFIATDMPSEQRLLAAAINKLLGMGAMTRGGRDNYSDSSVINLDGSSLLDQYGQLVVEPFLAQLFNRVYDHSWGIDGQAIIDRMGLMDAVRNFLSDAGTKKRIKVSAQQFLNRLLLLPLGVSTATDLLLVPNQIPNPCQLAPIASQSPLGPQEIIYELFTALRNEAIEIAKQKGTYDQGPQSLRAKNLRLITTKQLTDFADGQKLIYQVVEAEYESHRLPFANLRQKIAQEAWMSPGKVGFYADKETVFALYQVGAESYRWRQPHGRTGMVTDIATWNTTRGDSHIGDLSYEGNLQVPDSITLAATDHTIVKKWQDAYMQVPETYVEQVHLISGALLNVGHLLTAENTTIVRDQLPDGTVIIGRRLCGSQLSDFLKRFGETVAVKQLSAEEILELLNKGKTIRLHAGLELHTTRQFMQGQDVIELSGHGRVRIVPSLYETLEELGLHKEVKTSGNVRVFFLVPAENPVEVINNIIEHIQLITFGEWVEVVI